MANNQISVVEKVGPGVGETLRPVATLTNGGTDFQRILVETLDGSGVPQDVDFSGLGLKTDTVATTDTGTFSIIAFLKRAQQNWTTLQAKIPALIAGRMPVDVPIHPVQQAAAIQTADVVVQNAVAASANGATLPVTGYGVALFAVRGSFVASVVFEASVDAGANWDTISATLIAGDIVTAATVPGLYRISCADIDLLRARVIWTSGTSITITGRATNATMANKIIKLATGANVIGSIIGLPAALVGGRLDVNLGAATSSNLTPTRSSVSNSSSVAAGAQVVGFKNTGTVNVTLVGIALLPGETRTLVVPYPYKLAAIAYVATGGTLEILEVR